MASCVIGGGTALTSGVAGCGLAQCTCQMLPASVPTTPCAAPSDHAMPTAEPSSEVRERGAIVGALAPSVGIVSSKRSTSRVGPAPATTTTHLALPPPMVSSSSTAEACSMSISCGAGGRCAEYTGSREC